MHHLAKTLLATLVLLNLTALTLALVVARRSVGGRVGGRVCGLTLVALAGVYNCAVGVDDDPVALALANDADVPLAFGCFDGEELVVGRATQQRATTAAAALSHINRRLEDRVREIRHVQRVAIALCRIGTVTVAYIAHVLYAIGRVDGRDCNLARQALDLAVLIRYAQRNKVHGCVVLHGKVQLSCGVNQRENVERRQACPREAAQIKVKAQLLPGRPRSAVEVGQAARPDSAAANRKDDRVCGSKRDVGGLQARLENDRLERAFRVALKAVAERVSKAAVVDKRVKAGLDSGAATSQKTVEEGIRWRGGFVSIVLGEVVANACETAGKSGGERGLGRREEKRQAGRGLERAHGTALVSPVSRFACVLTNRRGCGPSGH